jgi:endonuclease/exonuclease/phosphatase (EEP) superfamily protein YafD
MSKYAPSNSAARTGPSAWTIAVAALCMAILVTALSGAYSTRADSVNILAPYWLTFAIAVLAMWIWRGTGRSRLRWAASALLVAFLLLTAFLLAPLAASRTLPPAGNSFRLVSFNMYKANPDPSRVSAWLARQDADIIVLLEAGPANRKALETLRGRYPYTYDCSGRNRCSTLILSRFPAAEVWPLARGDADNRRTLSAIVARFHVAGITLPITALHLNRPWPLGDQGPDLGRLTEAVASRGREGVIVGDFNSAPWTFLARGIARAGATRLASGATGTWPADAPSPALMLPLDQLYLGSCLEVTALHKGPDLGSDHLPIVADISTSRCSA